MALGTRRLLGVRPFESYTNEEQSAFYDRMEMYYKTQLLPAYNLVDIFTNELQAELKKRGLLRFETKRMISALRAPYKKVWNHLYTTNNKEFKEIFEDLCSQRSGSLYPLIVAINPNRVPREGEPWPLNQAIHAAMFDSGIRGDLDLYVLLEVASAVIDLCRTVFLGFDKAFTRRWGFVFNPQLPGACSCIKEGKMMEKLIERLCPYGKHRKFINDNRIRRSFIELTKHALSLDDIDRDCDASLSDNSERKAKLMRERDEYMRLCEYKQAKKEGRNYQIVLNSNTYTQIQSGEKTNIRLTDTQLRGMARRKADFVILRRGANGESMIWRLGRINQEHKAKLVERVNLESNNDYRI